MIARRWPRLAAAMLVLAALRAPALEAQQGAPVGGWTFEAGGPAAPPPLEVSADGSYVWGSARGRLWEVQPAFAQPGVRYFAGLGTAGGLVLAHAGERLDLLTVTGERVAAARRAAAPAANPLGIEWAGGGSAAGAPSPGAIPASPPAAATTGSNPLGIAWAGADDPPASPQPQPQPAAPAPAGSGGGLDIEWVGSAPARPAPGGPTNPTPAPAPGGSGRGLDVEWVGSGPSRPAPPPPGQPTNPSPSPGGAGGGLDVEWVGSGPSRPAPPAPVSPPPVSPPPVQPVPGVCRDPWVTEVVTRVLGRAPQGHADVGECDYRRYNGGRWNSKSELEKGVRAYYGKEIAPPTPTYSGVCRDPWVTEIITQVTGRKPNGQADLGECDYRRYNGGRWNSRSELEGHIRAAFGKPLPTSGICRDPWVTELVTATAGRKPNGEGESGECDIRRYNGGRWDSRRELDYHVRVAFGQPRHALYVIDGTASDSLHRNSMFQTYERWDGLAYYWEGVRDVAWASDAQRLYKTAYDFICAEVKKLGVQQVYLMGYSRGAIMAVQAANDLRRACGANVRFVGIVDAVNTNMWHADLEPGVPFSIHFRKFADWEHFLTTAIVKGIPELKAASGSDHHQMVCDERDPNREGWRVTMDTLVEKATQAGGRFRPARRTRTEC